MVKNSLARRATLDTPLAPAFEKHEGMLAIAWGGEDVVDLAKELDRLRVSRNSRASSSAAAPSTGRGSRRAT